MVEKYKLIPVGIRLFETLDIPSIFLVNVNNRNFFFSPKWSVYGFWMKNESLGLFGYYLTLFYLPKIFLNAISKIEYLGCILYLFVEIILNLNIIFNILESTISLKSCVHNAKNRFQFSDGERIDQSHSVNWSILSLFRPISDF